MKLRRPIAVLFTALAILVPVLHAAPAGASPGEFTSKINSLRGSKGLGSLSTNGSLQAQAQRWAEAMASKNSISHNPALGSTPGNWTKVGENVGTGGSVDSIFNALVASPGHYRNMVEGSYNSIGVGVATGSDGRIYTCHVFASFPGGGGSGGGGKSTKASAAKPAPAAVAPKGSGAPKSAPAAAATSGAARPSASPVTQGFAGNSNGGSAPAQTAESATPPPPPPAPQVVSGLGEVAAIHLQG